MAKISSETINEVNDRTDIIALVSEYARLEQRGDEWLGCCPFHNEKTPSFRVNSAKKMYYCFGCGAGGSTIQFYMEMEKLSFYDAVIALAKKAGVEVRYTEGGFIPDTPQDNIKEQYIELYGRVSGTYHFFLLSSEFGKPMREYLAKRGINEESIERFQLGYSPADRRWLKTFLIQKKYSAEFLFNSGLFSKKSPDISFFSNRLMFPIWDRRGKVIAFGGRSLDENSPKYINSGDLIQYKKGENLYAFHLAKQQIRSTRMVVICEGYMDVIAYHQAGIQTAVAPLGTALTQEQVKLLAPFADTFYLSFDSDKAGQEATYKAVLMCRKLDISVRVIMFEGGKDPAEILLVSGADSLTTYVKNAILDSDYLLSILMRQFPANTPEGKTKICLSYFPYLDALQSDIHRESCFEHLCQTLHLKPEAVKADFINRESARRRLETKLPDKAADKMSGGFKPNAEVRAVLAVIANLDLFSEMRNSLSADDFEDALARDMFITLEECFREDAVSSDTILSRCSGNVRGMVTEAVTSGEFALNSRQTIEDSIRLVKRNSLERKRERLMNQIRLISEQPLMKPQLDTLLNDKMSIDFELKKLKDTH